jgi:hypothetical protein
MCLDSFHKNVKGLFDNNEADATKWALMFNLKQL